MTCVAKHSLHDTLQACQSDNVTQLRAALTECFHQHSQACRHDFSQLLLSLGQNTLVWAREWLAAGSPKVRDLGLLRLVRDVLQAPGLVTFDAAGHLVQVKFNA